MTLRTEAEARETWCPMTRQLGTLVGRRDATQDDRTVAVGSQNRGYAMGGPLDNCKCIASQCAMWRWAASLTVNNPQRIPGAGQSIDTSRGYCGLAGRPEVA